MANANTTYQSMTDETLMRQLRERQKDAFHELYQRYSGRLLRFFFRMLGNDEETAQDFLHDIFLKVIERPAQYNPKQSFSTWIFVVAYNMCKNEYRRRNVRKYVTRVETTLLDEFPQIDGNPQDAETDCVLFHNALLKALELLSDNHRDVFLLRFQQQFSIKEISDITGCAEGTIKSRLFHATRQLADLLHDYNPYHDEGV
ncbi:sigma-70 family RNA polymerase sigma factor [candidate division KSB1 bacterium]|nr:sigma-70 family RNA polymerase sigma factor [candidate division KSB1 bacterium]